MSTMVEVLVYYKNSSRESLCFTHAVKAVVAGDEVSTEVSVDTADNDSCDSCFGMSFFECKECHK